jgi:hypothetical protein
LKSTVKISVPVGGRRLTKPVVDGRYNFCTEKYGKGPFRDEIDEEDNEGFLPVLGVKLFQPVLDAHFSDMVLIKLNTVQH